MKKRVFSLVLVIAMLLSMASGMTLRELAEDQTGIARQTEPSAEPSVAPETPAESEEPTETETPAESEAPAEPETPAEPEEDTDAPAADAPADESASDQEQTPSEDMDRPDAVEPGSPSTGGESDAVTEASAAEEPAAEDVNLLTADIEDEIMPIAAEDIDISSWEGYGSYYEQNGPFIPSGASETIILSFGNPYRYNEFKRQVEARQFTFTLTGPDSKTINLGDPTVTSTTCSVFWADMGSQIASAGPGTYTFKITDNKQTDKNPSDVTFTIDKFIFSTESGGKFPEEKTTHDSYGSQGASSLGFYKIPEITKTGDAEFIGWAAKTGVTTYNELVTNVRNGKSEGNNVYKLYAAYGTPRTYKLEFQKNNQTVTELTLDPNGETIQLKNTGNQPLSSVRPASKPDFISSVNLASSYIAPGDAIDVTIIPKKDLGPGSYSGKLDLFTAGGRWFYLDVAVTIGSARVTVTLSKDVEKEYGQALTSENVLELVEIEPENVADKLNLSFTSDGFDQSAVVKTAEGYDIKLSSYNSADYYVTFNAGGHKVVVKPVAPTGTVYTYGASVGQTLQGVTLHGTFSNPHTHATVTGRLEWTEPTKKLEQESGEGVECQWKFTPEGPDAANYTEATGTTKVVVSELETTDLYVVGTNTFTYNSLGRRVQFAATRGGETVTSGITVQYKPDGAPEGQWTEQAPTDVGTYDVKATIEANIQYAGAEYNGTMTIDPALVHAYYVIPSNKAPKVYDGTTDATGYVNVVMGNYDIKSADHGRVSMNYTVAFDKPDAGDRVIIITITGLTGDRAFNYKPASDTYSVRSRIDPRSVTVSVKDGESIEKSYGEDINPLTPDRFKAEGLADTDTIYDLKAEFTSEGAGSHAVVDGYDITVTIANSNYKLISDKAGTVAVNKAVPKLELASAGAGMEGAKLSTVDLTVEFVNPHTNEKVSGTYEWVDGDTIELPEEESSYQGKWRFTLDEDSQKNYAFEGDDPTTYESTAEVEVKDKNPIHVTAEAKTETYDGQKHRIEYALGEGFVEGENVRVLVEYKELKDIVRAVALDAAEDFEEYTTEEPIDAGRYEVHVHVTPMGEYADEYAESLVRSELTILAADPTPVEQGPILVPQGTTLSEITDQVEEPLGVDDKPLEGTFIWDSSDDTTVEADGTFHWTFVPSSKNYNSLHGSSEIELAGDTRDLTVTAYNLPEQEDPSLYDYAVVDLPKDGKNALKAGEEITLFLGEEPVSAPTTIVDADLVNGYVVITIFSEEFGDTAETLTARITSSTKHVGSEFEYPEELDVLVEGVTDNQAVSLYDNETKLLTAELVGGAKLAEPEAENVTFSVNEEDCVTVVHEKGNLLTVEIVAESDGHAHVELRIVLQHPDQRLHPGATIVIEKTIHVTVLPNPNGTGDLTVTKTVTGTAGEKTKDFTFTVTLSGTAAAEGTVTYGDVTFHNGVGTFTLKDGESKHMTDIPAGTEYKVEESDNEGYTVTKTGDMGTIPGNGSATAAFTNTKDAPEPTTEPTAEPTAVPTAAPTATAAPSTAADKSAPDTGDSNDPGLWLGLLAMSMAGLGAIGAVRRRKRSR